jgi:hypothetical protein
VIFIKEAGEEVRVGLEEVGLRNLEEVEAVVVLVAEEVASEVGVMEAVVATGEALVVGVTEGR